jgi:hypothetical protein
MTSFLINNFGLPTYSGFNIASPPNFYHNTSPTTSYIDFPYQYTTNPGTNLFMHDQCPHGYYYSQNCFYSNQIAYPSIPLNIIPAEPMKETKILNEPPVIPQNESAREYSQSPQPSNHSMNKRTNSIRESRNTNKSPVISINGIKQKIDNNNSVNEIFFHFDNKCLKFSIL